MDRLNRNFESDLEQVSDEMLKYIGITNLDFQSPLSEEELKEVQRMIFSINTLLQVSFKDGTRVNDIENVKMILESSPLVDDSKVEKMILRKNTLEEIKYLLSLPYSNPSTWNICYARENETYYITNLPNYRIMEEYITLVLSCVKEEMTPLEEIKEIYDFIKLLEFSDGASSRLSDIILTRKTNSYGFSLLFKTILERIGITSYIGNVDRDGNMDSVVLIEVNDDKYEADGIYIFDPMSDSIPKDSYKNEALRKINYNYFGLTLKQFLNSVGIEHHDMGIELLDSERLDYGMRRLDNKTKEELEKVFGMKLDKVWQRVQQTKMVSDDKMLDLVVMTLHDEDFARVNRDPKELIKNNYLLRKKDLFSEDDKTNFLNIHDI